MLRSDAGSYFNPDDAAAVRRLLYNDLGLPCPLETRHGNQAVSKAALAQLLPLHPLVAHLQTYRDAKSAYDSATAVLAAVDPPTSIVRGNLDPLGTATGRFSCSDPPLQALDRRVRRAIEARRPPSDGSRLLANGTPGACPLQPGRRPAARLPA